MWGFFCKEKDSGLDFASHKHKKKFQGSSFHLGGSKATGRLFSSNFKLQLYEKTV